MQKTLSLQFGAFAAALALTFSFAPYVLADTEYAEIEIEYEVRDNKTIVEVEYILDKDVDTKDDKVTKEFIYFTTDLDEVWEEVAEALDISESDIEDILDGEYGDNSNDDTTRDEADEVLDEALFLLEDVEFEIEDIDDEDDKIAAGKLYNEAEGLVDDAQDAFESGEYGDTVEYAEAAIEIFEAILDEDYDFDPDEEEEEEREDAEDAIADAEEEIAKAEEAIEDAEDDGKEVELSEKTLEEAEEVLKEAEEAFVDKDYEEAEELAEEAEDLAKLARMKYLGKTEADLDDDDDEDEKDDDDDRDDKKDWKCDDDFPGRGQGATKHCDDDDDSDDDRFKDFGKSDDREELQRQLQLLLTLLIQLLQQQL